MRYVFIPVSVLSLIILALYSYSIFLNSSKVKHCSGIVDVRCFYDGCDVALWNRDVIEVPVQEGWKIRDESISSYCWQEKFGIRISKPKGY